MILDEEQKLNPPPPIYSRDSDVDDKRASEWTGQHADFAPQQQQQSTSTSYYAASPAGSSSLASTSAHPSFSRPRASGLPYQAFKSTYLAARGRSLDKGFSVSPPPSQEVPHPFVTHDVNEDDWLRFLEDLRRAGSLTEKDISRSHLPIISWVPFVNELSAYGVQKLMKSRKSEVVARTIDTWNHHFFEPRKMQVVLMKGSVKISGLTDRPIGDLHTPIASAAPEKLYQSSLIPDTKTDKGKAKDEGDNTYRLFVLSVS